MPRQPRYRIVGLPQHVVHRGNNRQPTFLVDSDYRIYRHYLGEALEKHGCDVHAYCLMTNHVHLLVTPRTPNAISKVMQSAAHRYVRHFNRTYSRTGTLWEGRYKANLIADDAYALVCYRYVELNAVRARMVSDPAEYPYSSYSYNALGRPDPIVRPHPVYDALGGDDSARRTAYRALISLGLTAEELERIRSAAHHGAVLANEVTKANAGGGPDSRELGTRSSVSSRTRTVGSRVHSEPPPKSDPELPL